MLEVQVGSPPSTRTSTAVNPTWVRAVRGRRFSLGRTFRSVLLSKQEKMDEGTVLTDFKMRQQESSTYSYIPIIYGHTEPSLKFWVPPMNYSYIFICEL